MMRLLALLSCLTVSQCLATTWYVRPFRGTYSGGHEVPQAGVYGTQDGTSYANAWNGLLSVGWGPSKVTTGDTLYVCGTHAFVMTALNFSLAGISPQPGVTIRGDYPGDPGTIANPAIWALPNRTNWTAGANNVYSTTNIYNDANPATALAVFWEIDGTNIIRLFETNTTTWLAGSNTFYYNQPTNFIKTSYGGAPTNNMALSTYGYYFNYSGLSNLTFSSLRMVGAVLNRGSSDRANHITISNCVMSDECLPFLVVSNDFWTFSGCDISYCKDGGIYLFNNLDSTKGAKNTLITNCYIHDIDVTGFTRYTGGDGHGIGVRATATDVTIVNNHLARTASCIEFFGSVQSNATIAYNFIEDTHANAQTDGGGISLTGGGTKTNFLIYANVLRNIGTNSTQDFQGLGIDGGGTSTSFVKIWNNSIYNANSGLYFVPSPGPFYGQLLNNIIVSPRSHFLFINAIGTTNVSQVDYNLYYNTNGPANFVVIPALTRDAHSLYTNPLFVVSTPVNALDFALQGTSPAIAAGTNVGIAVDFSGNPYGNPPNMGAFTGGTFPSSDCDVATIQARINLANDGDTVTIPACATGWTTNLVITKAINLIGSGIGSTIITDSVSRVTGAGFGNTNLISWTLNNNARATLSGFEFRGDPAQPGNPGTGIMVVDGTSFQFRVCSNYWNQCNNRSVQQHGWVYGVYDHNVHLGTFKQFAEVWHDGYGSGSYGDKSWADQDFMGTTNAMYFETNNLMETFTASPGAIDMMGGARCVVRFNVFSNCTVTTHGTDTTGRQRSVRILENYFNVYKQNSGFSSTAGQYRGGTGVVWSNSYTGPDWNGGMSLTCYRELGQMGNWGTANGTNALDVNNATIFATGTHTGANGASVLTDGTKTWTVNGWTTNMLWNVTQNKAAKIDSNTGTTITYSLLYNSVAGGANMSFNNGDTYQVMAVYPALDQPGRGQGDLFNPTDPATPYTWPNQALDPVYSWSNTVGGVLGMNVGSSYPSILTGRDYNPNTLKPGYTPLVYPHPLVSGLPVPPPPNPLPHIIAKVNKFAVKNAITP